MAQSGTPTSELTAGRASPHEKSTWLPCNYSSIPRTAILTRRLWTYASCLMPPHPNRILYRDLEALGDYLLAYYARVFSVCGMDGNALVGELPFQWRTDFGFDWSEGWLNNRLKQSFERNL